MSSLFAPPSYTGIDIPVYTDETVPLCNRDQLRDPEQRESKLLEDGTLIRPVLFYPPTKMERDSLARILEKTDAELQYIARLCGATVVEHAWGLYQTKDNPTEDTLYDQAPHPALPRGHTLVAKVDHILDAQSLSLDNEEALTVLACKGIGEYYTRRSGEAILFDLSADQFVTGANKRQASVLVDIEPCWHDD